MTSTLTAVELQRLRGGLPVKAPRSKYGSKKVKAFDRDGNVITFDSKREARRWSELLLLEKAGTISHLERQVPYHFSAAGKFLTYSSNRKAKYVLDFRYWHEKLGDWIHEDAKGVRTDVYRLKKALMQLFHDIEIREV